MTDAHSSRHQLQARGLAAMLLAGAAGLAILPRAAEGQGLGAKDEPAQQAAVLTDLIPDDAALAIGVANLQRLKERGDRLYDQAGAEGLRFSEMFSQTYEYLGVKDLIDEQRPAVALLANLEDVGIKDDAVDQLLKALVIRLPVKSVPDAAKRFNLNDDAVKNARIVPVQSVLFLTFGCLKGDYLFLAGSERALESVLEGKPVGPSLAAQRRDAANAADVLVLGGTEPWGTSWKEFLERVEKGDESLRPEINDLLRETVPDARFVMVSATVDDGLHVRMAAYFKPGGTAEATLARLQPDPGDRADLAGLPAGNVLAIVVGEGEELRTLAIARGLLPTLLEMIGPDELLAENDPTRMLQTFDAVRPQLDGFKAALYATGAVTPSELSNRGMMASLFIFETDDPQQLLQSIAAKGISLGGDRAAEGLPPISLRHLPHRETIAGQAVDYLQLDTSEVDPNTAAALHDAFGPAWMNLRAAKRDGQLVVFLGSQQQLFERALEAPGAEQGGLAATPLLQSTQPRLDVHHQTALYLSAQQTVPALSGLDDQVVRAMNGEVDRISVAAVTVERDLLQLEFWLPLAELMALPEEWRRIFW